FAQFTARIATLDMITPDEVRLRLIMGGVDELVAHPRCTSTSPRVYANITSYHRPTLKHEKDQRSIEWTEQVNETLLELAAEDLASRPGMFRARVVSILYHLTPFLQHSQAETREIGVQAEPLSTRMRTNSS
ncbi:hypothetical protein THAOC_04182, partial [Thalassiosira oceanica]